MKSKRWIGLAAVALLAGGVGLAGQSAGAETTADPADFVVWSDAGYLSLQLRQTASQNRVVWTKPDGSTVVQPLTISSKCTLVVGSPALLSFSVSNGVVGIDNQGLGTRTSNPTGQSCPRAEGRVQNPETLTAALGAAFGSSYRIDFASLDIEGKQDAQLLYTTDTGPNSPSSGIVLATSSDNGPDVGPRDNNRVVVGTTGRADDFRSISLGTTTGELALDGGGDGTYLSSQLNTISGNADTVFKLVTSSSFDFTTSCGETIENEGLESIDSITFLRQIDKDGACEGDIGVTVQVQPNQPVGTAENRDVAFVDNSLIDSTGATVQVRARVRIDFIVDRLDGSGNPRTPTAINEELDRQISYDGTTWQSVNYCSTSDVTESGFFFNVGNVVHPAAQPWCLLQDKRTLDGNVIRQTLILDVGGDPRVG